MHLIADSGSTSTDWRVAGKPHFSLRTKGLNPMVVSEGFLMKEIKKVSESHLVKELVKEVSFFGAGCSRNEGIEKTRKVLQSCFPNATIQVESDLLAAARAVLGNETGVVAILGTGSNAAFYNGRILEQKVPSIGYLFGDDGAGMGIGRAVLKSYLYGENFWQPLINELGFEHEKTKVIQSMYESDKPNAFIAKYAQVAMDNLEIAQVESLVHAQFNQFFDDMVAPYLSISQRIGFVGSIAFFGREILSEICEERGMNLLNIIKQPIDALTKHLENEE